MTAAATSVELTSPAFSPEAPKKIVLKSCYGKTGHKLRLEPCRDLHTNAWLGVEKLSEEQKRQRTYIVEPGVTFRIIKDGSEFDLSNEKDARDWAWVQHCPQIATNRAGTDFKIKDGATDANDFNSFEGADLEFYVYDEESEQLAQEKHFSLEFQALQFIHDQSPTERLQTARLLGSNLENSKPHEVSNYLNGKARKHPEQVLRVKNDKDSKARLFLFTALDKQIIRKSAGVYYYNDTALGTTEAQVMLWLSEDRNYTLVRAMSLEMYPALAPKAVVSEANQEIFNRATQAPTAHDAGALTPESPMAPAFTGEVTGNELEFENEDPDAVLGNQPAAADDQFTPPAANQPRAASRRTSR